MKSDSINLIQVTELFELFEVEHMMGGAKKQKMTEQQFVEQELSVIVEMTIRMEDALNHVVSDTD